MKYRTILPILLSATIILSGCGASTASSANTTTSTTSATSEATTDSESTLPIDTSDMFSDRDMEIGYDEEDCETITLSGDTASSSLKSVKISDGTITITEEGSYIISGTLNNGMIIVDVDDSSKVQLILDNATITNDTSAAIYVLEADKVFITTAADSTNALTNGGEYVAIDDNNIDAVIFSKADLTLNGSGTLNITAKSGHGIVSKDDLVVTSGTYNIDSETHGLSGKDSVRIASGTFNITCGEDAVHASNSDDSSLGFVYIADGTFNISAGDDGIHADSACVISGGTIDITESEEGIEGLSVDITGGTINVISKDDGINAAGSSDSRSSRDNKISDNVNFSANGDAPKDGNFSGNGEVPDNGGDSGNGGGMSEGTEGAYIHISGGTIYINASGDGIDSNGSLTISGGETYVSGPTDNGNAAVDYDSDATISGGILVAAGSSGMAQNFNSSSTQGVMLVSVDSASAGSTITLRDSNGNELISWTPEKSYDCIIVSCPELTEGSTYTLTTGNSSTELTMDSLVYGSGGGMMGGMNGDHGGMDGRGDMRRTFRNNSNGEAPTPPDGNNSNREMPNPPDGNAPNGNMPGTSNGNSSENDSSTNSSSTF